MKEMIRTSLVFGLLVAAIVFSAGSIDGGIMQAANCCECLDGKSCLADDANVCANNLGNQIGGVDNAVDVNSEACLNECSDDCDGFHFEVQ